MGGPTCPNCGAPPTQPVEPSALWGYRLKGPEKPEPEPPPRLEGRSHPSRKRPVAVGVAAVAAVVVVGVVVAVISRAGGGEGRDLRDLASASGLGALPLAPGADDLSPEEVQLGELLFFDPRLSGDGSTSCASCHDPELGWGDGNALSKGYPGTLHWRNSQTVLNAVYLEKLFWAGEALTAERQADSAFTGPLAGNLDPTMAEERLAQIPEYVRRFEEVYGTFTPQWPDVLKAVVAFERTIVSRNVPFDRWMGGDDSALSSEAKRGLELFIGKAGCAQCHSGQLLTDESFHSLGVPRNPEFDSDVLRQIALRWQVLARGASEGEYRKATDDLGLYYTTKQESDKGKFRTPPLREVSITGPYMHSGVLATLKDVVAFYNGGGGEGPNKSPLMKPLGLSESEVDDLVAFLESLTGDPVVVEPPDLPEYEVLPP